MAVLIVVALVIVALAVIIAVAMVVARVVSRHLSRTRHQASTIFAVQMALAAVVQAALKRADTVSTNGQSASRPGTDGGRTDTDARARQTVTQQLPLVQDVQLKELTHSLLERTRQVHGARDPCEADRLRQEVAALHAGFGHRSTEVVRSLNLRRR